MHFGRIAEIYPPKKSQLSQSNTSTQNRNSSFRRRMSEKFDLATSLITDSWIRSFRCSAIASIPDMARWTTSILLLVSSLSNMPTYYWINVSNLFGRWLTVVEKHFIASYFSYVSVRFNNVLANRSIKLSNCTLPRIWLFSLPDRRSSITMVRHLRAVSFFRLDASNRNSNIYISAPPSWTNRLINTLSIFVIRGSLHKKFLITAALRQWIIYTGNYS
jgi:hypothetical protein